MELTLGYVKSEKQMVIRSFDDQANSKVIDIEELKTQPLDALFIAPNLNTDEISTQLSDASKYFPVRPATEMNLDADDFDKLPEEQAAAYFHKMQGAWVLKNNLRLVNDLTQVINHLKILWPNNRNDFFQELWFLLKTNLGASSLTLIYNDLKKAEKETEKDKLIKVRIEGEQVPQPFDGAEAEEAIFKNYENEFGLPFHICDHDLNKGELVATMSIKQSPIVLMAKAGKLTTLQQSLVKTLAEALDSFI